MPSLQPNILFVVLKEHLFTFEEEIYVSINEPIHIHALRFAPHKCQSMNDVL